MMAEADERQQEDKIKKLCIAAFQSGEKRMAEELFPHIKSADVRISFRSLLPNSASGILAGSLLHLAAYWGWKDIAVRLISLQKSSTAWRDDGGHIALQYAAYNGHLDIVAYFITELLCDPMSRNKTGATSLHMACISGHLNIVRYFVSEAHCNPSCQDNSGTTPLHAACNYGHLSIVRYLIDEAYCNPSCEDNSGSTPLHKACGSGHPNIVQYLINEARSNPLCKDKNGSLSLHHACSNGHINIVEYFIKEALGNPSCENNDGWMPIHCACRNGHFKIIQYLIVEAHCDPSCRSNTGSTPLHYACECGHLNIAQYLINEAHCNPSCQDADGSTPLHFACRFGYPDIVQYLINEVHCNPKCEDSFGWTPLHWACNENRPRIVQYLLSTGRVNPLAEDDDSQTPLFYATGHYDVVKLFQPFVDSSKDFPVHTFTKLILTGDSGAGKTTIAQLIVRILGRYNTAIPIDSVDEVEYFTAGIILHHIKSVQELGNFILYDFAGQQEYYSSHAAILEQVMRKSPAMFLCLIDLSKSNDDICQSLQYWLTFINNACSVVEERSHIAVIGSHADLVASSKELQEKSMLLQKIACMRIKRQRNINAGVVIMDCRQADTEASHNLISALTTTHEIITADQPNVSYYCHVLYAFLRTRLEEVGCTLNDLISAIASEGDFLLPSDSSILIELLTTLCDRGLILFMEHPQFSSWVIAKMEILLNDINGTLFAPRHFKEYCDIASNTGIVTTSNLRKRFLQHNLHMLIGFLLSLDFCRLVDFSVLKHTNLKAILTDSTDDLLFFPGLVLSERPDGLTQRDELRFGWCLGCMDPHEFFSSRFLHVLLLLVAYKYPLDSHDFSPMCTFWKNGIYWRNYDNIVTVIELLDNNRWVLVGMSCDTNYSSQMEHAKLRSSLIALVRCLQQEYCPCLNVCEFLISPCLTSQYPFDSLPDSNLFHIHHVAQSILLRKPVVPSRKNSRGCLPIQSLPFEPYKVLSPSIVCQLCDPSMADLPAPFELLQKVRQLCQHPKMKAQSYKDIREQLDNLSIFAGINPLVSEKIAVS